MPASIWDHDAVGAALAKLRGDQSAARKSDLCCGHSFSAMDVARIGAWIAGDDVVITCRCGRLSLQLCPDHRWLLASDGRVWGPDPELPALVAEAARAI